MAEEIRDPEVDRGKGLLSGVRVVVLTSGHDVLDGRVYGREAQSLHALGADVTVVGKLTRGTPRDVKVLVIPAESSRWMRFVVQPWRCLWKARRLEADIVHFHDAEMLAILPIARMWWPRAKFVYDVHEDFANLMLIREWLPDWMKPAVKRLTNGVEKTLAGLADGIVGVTPPLAEKFAHRRKAVVYNFVPEDFFDRAQASARPPRQRDFDLLHLGTLNSRRALFLADVFHAFHRLRPEARTMILGATPDIERLLAGRLPAGCVVVGKTPFDRIPAFLGNARIGLDVHPWLGEHLQVALPVKVCEYMAAGCAVVTSSMPVLETVLRESGVERDTVAVIVGGEPEDYAREAARIAADIDAGRDPGSKARDLARRFMSFGPQGEKLGGLYLSLLETPCVR